MLIPRVLTGGQVVIKFQSFQKFKSFKVSRFQRLQGFKGSKVSRFQRFQGFKSFKVFIRFKGFKVSKVFQKFLGFKSLGFRVSKGSKIQRFNNKEGQCEDNHLLVVCYCCT